MSPTVKLTRDPSNFAMLASWLAGLIELVRPAEPAAGLPAMCAAIFASVGGGGIKMTEDGMAEDIVDKKKKRNAI